MSMAAVGASVAGAATTQALKDDGTPARTTRTQQLPGWAQPLMESTGERGVAAGQQMQFVPLTAPQQQSLGQMERFASGMNTAGLAPGQSVQAGADLARQTVEGDFLSPSTNPALGETIDAATGRVMDNFERSVLPQLGSQAQQAGAWGGARQGLMEAQAADEVSRNVGELSSQMLMDAYQSERGRQQQAMRMLPTLAESEANMGLMPSQILGQVGEVQRQEQQARQQFPFQREQQIGDFLSGITRGQGSSTSTEQRAQPSSFVQGMQGALGGAQLYNTANDSGMFSEWGGSNNQQSLFNNNLQSGKRNAFGGGGAGGMAF